MIPVIIARMIYRRIKDMSYGWRGMMFYGDMLTATTCRMASPLGQDRWGVEGELGEKLKSVYRDYNLSPGRLS